MPLIYFEMARNYENDAKNIERVIQKRVEEKEKASPIRQIELSHLIAHYRRVHRELVYTAAILKARGEQYANEKH